MSQHAHAVRVYPADSSLYQVIGNGFLLQPAIAGDDTVVAAAGALQTLQPRPYNHIPGVN